MLHPLIINNSPLPRQTTQNTTYKQQQRTNEKRYTLLVGYSTGKLVNERRVIANKAISECRPATLTDLFHKIKTGGTRQMDILYFMLGQTTFETARWSTRLYRAWNA